uniref:Uncharacterized protein n=1 Tax=Arundo donax TaxID=35708 RepID=A0A0A9ERH6_ARUDO
MLYASMTKDECSQHFYLQAHVY